MERSDRRIRIGEKLKATPNNHAQVYTSLIAIPPSEREISPTRRQELEASLSQHQSNLIPLILRRTTAYTEDEEFEVIYGADWCIVAQEIGIEKLWVWVFDIPDEEVDNIKAEMQQLLGNNIALPLPPHPKQESNNPANNELKEVKILLQRLEKSWQQDIKLLNQKIDDRLNLTDFYQQLEKLIDSKLENALQNVTPREVIVRESSVSQPKKLNLALNLAIATIDEITDAIGNQKQATAAYKAIQKWKESGKKLTWANLEKSTKPGSYKVNGFGKETYKELKTIGYIEEES